MGARWTITPTPWTTQQQWKSTNTCKGWILQTYCEWAKPATERADSTSTQFKDRTDYSVATEFKQWLCVCVHVCACLCMCVKLWLCSLTGCHQVHRVWGPLGGLCLLAFLCTPYLKHRLHTEMYTIKWVNLKCGAQWMVTCLSWVFDFVKCCSRLLEMELRAVRYGPCLCGSL